MERRTVLAAIGGLVGAGGISGCLGDGPVETPTPSAASPTDPGGYPATPSETTFDVRDRSCGTGRNAATIAFEDDAARVEGLIGGRDTCDTALLEATRLDAGTLSIRIAVVEESPDGMVVCAECLTDIEYAFAATVPGGPSSVAVTHRTADGESTVATADRP